MRYIIITLVLTIALYGCKKDDEPVIVNENAKAVGISASDFLSDSKYQSINIEIHYMQGYEPDTNGLNLAVAFLNKYCNKPGGITYTTKRIANNGSTLTTDNIVNIETQNRTLFNNGNVLAVYILFTDGNYTEDGVLGVAYRNTSLCMFGRTINENSGSIGQVSRTKLTATILEHEFGHLLGLVGVNTVTQTDHKDATHGNHCNNAKCLMYYAAQTVDIKGHILVTPIPDLDSNCRNDIRAYGGK